MRKSLGSEPLFGVEGGFGGEGGYLGYDSYLKVRPFIVTPGAIGTNFDNG